MTPQARIPGGRMTAVLSPARRQPTRRQLEVLRAYIAAGSAAAAYELCISETTARQHLSGLYRRTGCLNAAQAAYLLGTRQLDRDATPHRRVRGLARS
jgi:DNA-binding NarL/FixJ family response regulator